MRVRYQKTGWWGMNEIEYQTCCGLWGQGLYHSLLLKQQPPQWAPGSQPIWATALFTICWRKQLGLSLSYSHTHIHTHNHSSLHIWRERIERVPYCPLSGDVGVCVRAWLLLVYIRVLNSRIALSIWARQIYLCCGSFMHLLFPKRIGMHQWKRG